MYTTHMANPEGKKARRTHTIPDNPGKGCSDLFNAFASEGLIGDVTTEDVVYHNRRGKWFQQQRDRKKTSSNNLF